MKEQLSRFFNKPGVIPISVGIISFSAGVGIGYILGKRNRFEFHTLSNNVVLEFNDEELDDIDEKVLIIPAQEITEIPEYKIIEGKSVKIVKTLDEDFLKDEIRIGEKVPLKDITEKVVIIPTKTQDDNWSYAQEIKNRTQEEPYIIHKDEFYSNEKDFVQSTLTYFAGDDIMNDEDDTPMYNHVEIVGPLRFGHGSGDPNVVHVRNEKRKAEYEIIFDPGLYSVEVLGLTIEDNERAKDIQHSKHRKFQME